ncbi:WG repeat-containing protein [Pedobacter cryoconitis]|uniref:WG repeat protein n=1 Tax=Pedobacter cryoconitis TaxID=188932 RepID=A0A7X0IZY0_9SPHI|nr:WG repeat-containing protein [Pedobacter cryoconitis]MBB6498535.1 hypothetical protein [Pedobacter cryoconitis]
MKTQIPELYPWLTETGKFCYCDELGNPVIQTEFDEASLYTNGYAIVGSMGRYGVIDVYGKQVLQPQYVSVKLFSTETDTLLVTQKSYNAWWQFWNWRLMPDIYVVTSNNRGFLRVCKSKWQIRSLSARKILFSQCLMKGSHLDNSWNYIKIAGNGKSFVVMDNCYQLNPEKKLRTGFDQVTHILNTEYTAKENIEFNTSSTGEKITVDKHHYYQYELIEPLARADIYKSNEGKVYLFPDLVKPVPVLISDYEGLGGNFTAAEILKGITLIKSIPNSNFFLVITRGFERTDKWTGAFLLDTEGNWNTQVPVYSGFQEMFSDGRLAFKQSSGVSILYPDLSSHEMNIDEILGTCAFSEYWYRVKDKLKKKYGIYDTEKREWQVQPAYDYLEDEIAPGIAVYTVKRTDVNGYNQKEYKGLIDIINDRLITAAIYDQINPEGEVTKTECSKKLRFYLNIHTGKEYRKTNHQFPV